MEKKTGANRYILRVIHEGYKIQFKEYHKIFMQKITNPQGKILIHHRRNTRNTKVGFKKTCCSEVADKPTVINPLTVVYNKNGMPRLFIDCWHINEKNTQV